ncbi:Ribosomal protein S5 domain 2-type fold [Moorella glycerini]|uniref:IMPACT family member YigZ n=1 Tax=Neomoorella stamsii TaxID=1266720 RepID=A0A9X7J2N1_9FIRM|nr:MULTISPECIES: YigZ family protein [Moorella]PRR72346.1 IMPACT family member YigZ [Moorella stamsii]CEP68843.1 Ribosomal protein S5 domain 2-type fold [Moorella glycerini]
MKRKEEQPDGLAAKSGASYLTVAREATAEIKIERSRFIGHAREVDSEAAAREFIARVQAEHRQATHNCFAYRLGMGKQEIAYYSDAGEPSGTAGRPILGAISSLGLTNVAVVVTRYFGGKKLGVRGLIEAYGQAARRVLEEAGSIRRVVTRELELTCSYAELDQLLYQIQSHGGKVIETEYGSEVRLKVAVPLSAWEQGLVPEKPLSELKGFLKGMKLDGIRDEEDR